MNNENMVVIPYVAHEGLVMHFERVNKRLAVILAIVVALLFLSNCFWLYAWMQYDYTSDATVTVDGKDGVANYIGNDGEITNGTGSCEESPNTDTGAGK